MKIRGIQKQLKKLSIWDRGVVCVHVGVFTQHKVQ